jgi:hypothetical protein
MDSTGLLKLWGTIILIITFLVYGLLCLRHFKTRSSKIDAELKKADSSERKSNRNPYSISM